MVFLDDVVFLVGRDSADRAKRVGRSISYPGVAATGVAALSLVNSWLIIAMARKLRGQGEELARRGSRPRRDVGLPPGTRVPEFTVTTMTGATISAEHFRGERSVVAFFSPGCEPCHEQAPVFAAFARARPDGAGGSRTLAVICGGHRAAGSPTVTRPASPVSSRT